MSKTAPDLEDLLDRLREAGLVIGPHEVRRLHRVFESMLEADRANLRSVLRSVLAKSADEAAKLDEITSTWIDEVESSLDDVGFDLMPARPAPEQETLPPEAGTPRGLVKVIAMALGLLLVTVLAVLLWPQPEAEFRKAPPASETETKAEEDVRDQVALGDAAPIHELPRDYRNRPLFIEPLSTYTTWHVDDITLEPISRPDIPWMWVVLSAAAALAAVFLIRRHQKALELAPVTASRPGPTDRTHTVVPPPARELLSARDAVQLVAGVGHFVDEEPTTKLDVAATVETTARAAGYPRFIYESPRHLREVWFWIDDAVVDDLSLGLLEQARSDLVRAGLAVRQAAFHRRPDKLVWSQDDLRATGENPLTDSPGTLDGRRDQVIVALVTPGEGFIRGVESAGEFQKTERLLKQLAAWPRLSVIQTPQLPSPWRRDASVELPALTRRFRLRCHPIHDLVEIIAEHAGAATSPRLTTLEDHTRGLWLAGLALAPTPFSSGEALELRTRLSLDAEPWHFSELTIDLVKSGDLWSMSDGRRARYSAVLASRGGALVQALTFWRERLAADAEAARDHESEAHPWKGTAAEQRWQLQGALLDLWDRPHDAAHSLDELDRTPVRGELRELLSRRMPRRAERTRGYIMFPWSLGELDLTARSRLIAMGLARRLLTARRSKVKPGNLGLALGILAGVLAVGLMIVSDSMTGSGSNATSQFQLEAVGFPQAVLDAWKFEPPPEGAALKTNERSYRLDGIEYPVRAMRGTLRVRASSQTRDSVEKRPWGELWHAGVSPRLFLKGLNEKPTRIYVIEDFKMGRALAIRLLDRCVAAQVAVARQSRFNDVFADLSATKRELIFVAREPINLKVSRLVRTDFEPLIAALDAPATRAASEFDDKRIPTLFLNTKPFPDLEMIPIPGGSFEMGGSYDDEQPRRTVSTQPYRILRHEVTRRLFGAVMGKEHAAVKSWSDARSATRPADSVTWYESNRFAARLAHLLGQTTAYIFPSEESDVTPEEWTAETPGWRLPTEAEWERACRAGTTTVYHFGEADIARYAWHDQEVDSDSHPVATTRFANPWGIEDITGNLIEWCWDWHTSSGYDADDLEDPRGASTGDDRVLRGGGYWVTAFGCRSANRNRIDPSGRNDGVGFRLVLPARATR